MDVHTTWRVYGKPQMSRRSARVALAMATGNMYDADFPLLRAARGPREPSQKGRPASAKAPHLNVRDTPGAACGQRLCAGATPRWHRLPSNGRPGDGRASTYPYRPSTVVTCSEVDSRANHLARAQQHESYIDMPSCNINRRTANGYRGSIGLGLHIYTYIHIDNVAK